MARPFPTLSEQKSAPPIVEKLVEENGDDLAIERDDMFDEDGDESPQIPNEYRRASVVSRRSEYISPESA